MPEHIAICHHFANLPSAVEDREKHIAALKKELQKQTMKLNVEKKELGAAEKATDEAEKQFSKLGSELKATKYLNSDLRSQLASTREALRHEQEKRISRENSNEHTLRSLYST